MIGTIASRVSKEHLDVIECGLFTSWPQQGPVHKGYFPFGNVNCLINFNGLVTVEKIEEGLELTHRVEGIYKGIWPLEAESDFLTEDIKRKIIYTEDFNAYRISDARPGEFVLLQDEAQVTNPLDTDGQDLAISYAAEQLCGKLAMRIDAYLGK